MKVETLAGIAKTASVMGVIITLTEVGLACRLQDGGRVIVNLVPWLLLDESVDPHGLCAIEFGNMFNAMKQAEADDTGRPQ
jgi:hypothetical protein